MTAATSPSSPWRPPGSEDSRHDACVLSKGEWAFPLSPASPHETNAFLRYVSNRIELLYLFATFEDFLMEMSDIQGGFEHLRPKRFARLWPRRSAVVDWAGQARHV